MVVRAVPVAVETKSPGDLLQGVSGVKRRVTCAAGDTAPSDRALTRRVDEMGSRVFPTLHKQPLVEFSPPAPLKVKWTPEQINRGLVNASASGNIARVKEFLALGAHPAYETRKTRCAFLQAAVNNHYEIVELFLNAKLDPPLTTTHLNQALFSAVFNSNYYLIDLLLKKGADGSFLDRNGRSALHCVVVKRDITALNLLLEAKCNIESKNLLGNTALHLAALSGCSEIVSALINKGAKVNEENALLNTPLHFAAAHGRTEVVNILLEHGASVAAVNSKGETPLHCAAMANDVLSIRRIVENKGDLNARDFHGKTPLEQAIQSNHLAAVKQLLFFGAKVSEKGVRKYTPLQLAVFHGVDEKIVEALIEHGSDIHIKAEVKNSLLHLAAKCKNAKIVSLLIKYGLSVAEKNSKNFVPLTIAVHNNNEEVVEVLFSHGATFDEENGSSLLQYAAEHGSIHMVDTLLKAGARLSPSVPDDFLPRLFHLYRFSTIMLLIEHGADPFKHSKDSESLLELAAVYYFPDIIKCIVEKYAERSFPKVNHTGFTPYCYAMGLGYEDAASLLKEDLYSKKFMAIKSLAQFSGLTGTFRIDDKSFHLEKFYSPYLCKEYAKKADEDLKEAFTLASDLTYEAKDICKRIQDNKLCVILSGHRIHSVNIVIKGSYMIVCNRGDWSSTRYGNRDSSTMKCFKIDPAKFNAELVYRLQLKSNLYFSTSEFGSYCYEELPKLLSRDEVVIDASTDEVCRQLESIAPKPQKVANCTAASLKTAIRAAYGLLEYEKTGSLTESQLETVKTKSKMISLEMRKHFEEKCAEVFMDAEGKVHDTAMAVIVRSQEKSTRHAEKLEPPRPLDEVDVLLDTV